MVGILKIFEKSLGIGLLLTFIFSFTGFANNCDNLSSKVLRLHILANSDSKADQELKIKVRDKIIEKSGDFLNGATDKVSAQNLTAENLENIKKIALEEVQEQGYYYPISVEITDMYFPTRKYGNTTFPAGHYDALRVLIGEGKGQNWWCVIFPQMCLGSAKKIATTDTILNDSEKDIINSDEKYEIKFKMVEYFYAIKNVILNWFK